MIDELLYIFKLKDSSKSDKNPNREIRNELVGHPISRDENHKLKSSVLFGFEQLNNQLQYMKYDIRDGFKGQLQLLDFSAVIKRHK